MKVQKYSILLLFSFLLWFTSCTQTKKSYYPNGKIMSEISYRFGKEHGISKYYYQDHSNRVELEVSMKNGKKEGDCIHYYYTGKAESITHYVQDSIDGIQSAYDWDGTKLSETHYKNGKKHGEHCTWHPNRQLMIKGSFYQDLFDGVWEYYDERGFSVGEARFDKGKGVQYGYDENGNLIRISHFENNMKNGKEISFNAQGDTTQILLFKDDYIVDLILDTTQDSLR